MKIHFTRTNSTIERWILLTLTVALAAVISVALLRRQSLIEQREQLLANLHGRQLEQSGDSFAVSKIRANPATTQASGLDSIYLAIGYNPEPILNAVKAATPYGLRVTVLQAVRAPQGKVVLSGNAESAESIYAFLANQLKDTHWDSVELVRLNQNQLNTTAGTPVATFEIVLRWKVSQ